MNTIDRINLRFKSGNNTPVERAYVTAEEWAQLREAVTALRLLKGCAHPVAESINPRGHNWCEAYLDEALPIANAALSTLTEDKG